LKRIGFLVNPIAGMGGAVGLKGTDGDTYLEALKRGAKPVTPNKARIFLSSIKHKSDIYLISAPRDMGEIIVREYDIEYEIVGSLRGNTTTDKDTKRIIKKIIDRGIDLLIFVGGDGTARDIYDVIGAEIPVLGVPSGVKMFGSVFAINPRAAAEVIDAFVEGEVDIEENEVLDINEEAFRKSLLDVRLYGYMKIPLVRDLVQVGKEPSHTKISEKSNKHAIANYFKENIEENVLYLLGPGTTIRLITDEFNLDKTLLGIDALYNNNLIGRDLNESEILNLLEKFEKAKIVVSPIGGQGFIFGRGNQEFSPKILEKVGKNNIIVVSTRSKIDKLSCLRVDVGKDEINELLRGYTRVITDYNQEVLKKVL
jgi:predicted polyphosphate/ATP-dependent NAD kinase